jgi:hypothetical protein
MTSRTRASWLVLLAALAFGVLPGGSVLLAQDAPADPPQDTPAPAPAPAPAQQAAPAAAPTAPRVVSRPRPKTFAELRDTLTKLTTAGDVEGLWATCRDLKPSHLPDEPAAGVWIELCKGRALQGLQGPQDRDKARVAYREVIRLASTAAGIKHAESALAASEARYRLGELAESDHADYALCLRQLGIFWGSRQEAEEKISRLATAERAYKEAIPGAQRPWPQRAAFRVTALHVNFYLEVSGKTAPTFRGLPGPPPLASANTDVAQLALRRILDPNHSTWPQTLKDVTDAARRRAEVDNDDPDLLVEARTLERAVANVPAPPTAPTASPHPRRTGTDRGWKAITVDGEQVVFTDTTGAVKREPVLSAGRTLMDVVAGGPSEKWAPDAAVALGLGGYRAALPLLRTAAASQDEELAVASVFALGELGAAADVPVLLAAYARGEPLGDGPQPFETPSAALFGIRERALEALIKVGRRDPLQVIELMRSPLPPRESSYVLWQVARKELRPVYQTVVHHPDDAAAAYAMMALASVAPLEARPTLRELQNRKGTACWATHLEQLLGPRLRPRSTVPTTSAVP